jgi:maltooligosyltrehalose trehalohydrolase
MHAFRIWAPNAHRLRIVVDGATYDMAPRLEGHWHAEVETAHHGSDYAFLINDDPHSYPDPRSPWQRNGVHAASRVIDHALFAWQTPADRSAPPLAQSIFYELHIGTFTREGTFDAAIDRLPYLKDLGITHVELMPVASFEGRWGWGYDGVAIFAPQENYGGPDALKRFVDAAHSVGLAVALDVVYNHFGPAGNYTGIFAPYLAHQAGHTLWGSSVNLHGEGSRHVRRFFCDNALMWFRDYRIDSLRLDAIHALKDDQEPFFLTQLSAEVEALSHELHRPLTLIAESDYNDAIVVMPRDHGGRGMHAQWSDDFHHALHAVLTGEHQGYYHGFGSIAQLAQSLHSIFVRQPQTSATGDSTSPHPVGHLSADHFLSYIQDHDQVGNRSHGDRIHHLAGLAAARIAAAFVLTGPSVPLIFQGEEFAATTPFLFFADHADPPLRAAVAKGRRMEFDAFGWSDDIPDPEAPSSFENSRLDWHDLEEPESAAMLRWYRQLIHLRREHPALADGNLGHLHVSFSESARWLIMTRGNIQVICNFAKEPQSLVIPPGATLLLCSEPVMHFNNGYIDCPALSAAILKQGDCCDRDRNGCIPAACPLGPPTMR